MLDVNCRNQAITLVETALLPCQFEVNNLEPSPHLAFPHFLTQKNLRKSLVFDG
jgi:hypothetical protein